MNEELGSYESCSNIVLPSLVISKINYNPQSAELVDSNDLEFIEILNNSNESVDLTGVYIGTGLVYQFPANSNIRAGQKIMLVNNTSTFEEKYRDIPFGEFSRSLSDGGQTIIDEVTYDDEEPWPVDADGNGAYLELIDPSADNNNPANWFAAVSIVLGLDDRVHSEINTFPNPSEDIFSIESKLRILEILVLNLEGKVLVKASVNDFAYQLDLSNLNSGIYLLEISTDRELISGRKIIIK